MKVAIIADDLTGANDSGVQLARYGLTTSVLLDKNRESLGKSDVVILDTDSRSIHQDAAYTRVTEICKFIKQETFDVIYKKIDSTMRGNVGAEINAVFDVFEPDFVLIAPALPKSKREIVHGYHYLHDRLLHETEVACDPKTPVKESFLPKLLKLQTNREIGHIPLDDLQRGAPLVCERLCEFRKQNIRYVLFDSRTEEDLKKIVDFVRKMNLKVIWAGSAGLAECLPESYGLQREEKILHFEKRNSSVMLVMGSVSRVGRKQLEKVLSDSKVKGIKMRSELVVSHAPVRDAEIERVLKEAVQAIEKGESIALYSSGNPNDIELAFQAGKQLGLDHTQVSNLISQCIGRVATELIKRYSLNRVVLTGGDTAKQVLLQLGAGQLTLIDEIEPGVPVGYVNGIFAVTKAGSFGSTSALLHAMLKLQGEEGYR